jgi:hypothetical protein
MQNNLDSHRKQQNGNSSNAKSSKGPFIITTSNVNQTKTTNCRPLQENPMTHLLHSKQCASPENLMAYYSFPTSFSHSSFSPPLYIPRFLMINPELGKLPMTYNLHYASQPALTSLTPFLSESKPVSNICASQPGLPTNPNLFPSRNQRSANPKGILSGKAYVSRNVYKSIVRFLFICVQKNHEAITEILHNAGFSNETIEKCFKKLKGYNESVKAQNSKKNSQSLIRKIVRESSARTYVLRETLYAMLQNSKLGKLGRISERNKQVYNDVCKYYYNEIIESIGQSTQVKSFAL